MMYDCIVVSHLGDRDRDESENFEEDAVMEDFEEPPHAY